jgi:hypothetical protein
MARIKHYKKVLFKRSPNKRYKRKRRSSKNKKNKNNKFYNALTSNY